MTNVKINPSVSTHVYGLDYFTYILEIAQDSPSELHLYDYAPVSIPANYTVELGISASDESIGVDLSFARSVSDLTINDTSAPESDKMKVTMDVIPLTTYGKGTTNFNFAALYNDSSNSSNVELRKEATAKFMPNSPFFYAIEYTVYLSDITI